jgi:small subunit ribosomal protein S16
MDARAKRDGRAIEEIGKYHPKNDPSFIEVNSERVQYWLGVGAQPTEAVVAILKRSGDWQKHTGDDTPSGIDPQPVKADRTELFNKALGNTEGAANVEAFSAKKVETKPATEAPESAEESQTSEAEAEA